jgi:anti-sigma B factor antagonist
MKQLAHLAVRRSGGVVVAEVSGEIDMSNAADLRNAVVAELAHESTGLVLDLSDVTYLDSAAIHVIYELRERLSGRALALRLVVPPGAPTVEALRLTGVPQAVPVSATAAEAESSIG